MQLLDLRGCTTRIGEVLSIATRHLESKGSITSRLGVFPGVRNPKMSIVRREEKIAESKGPSVETTMVENALATAWVGEPQTTISNWNHVGHESSNEHAPYCTIHY